MSRARAAAVKCVRHALPLIADSDEAVLRTYYEIGISPIETMLYAVCREIYCYSSPFDGRVALRFEVVVGVCCLFGNGGGSWRIESQIDERMGIGRVLTIAEYRGT